MEDILNFVKSLLYALFVYLGIKTGIVKVLFLLMVIDSVLGVIKAFRLGQKFSLKRLGWGMVSKLSILVIPMIVALMAKGLSLNFNYFVVAIIDIIIVNEGISCITNILAIKTKKQIENTDYITKMLEAIRRAFMSIIQRLLCAIEKNNITDKK
ncbi:MAG: phage holin family protein [Acidobacteriota bacterium]|jgi:phage-related holin